MSEAPSRKRKREPEVTPSESAAQIHDGQGEEKALTKAKKRYLKRKKERAKAKRAANKLAIKGAKAQRQGEDDDDDDDDKKDATESSVKADLKKRKREKKDADVDTQDGPLNDEEWEKKQQADIAQRKEEKRRKRELRRQKPTEEAMETQADQTEEEKMEEAVEDDEEEPSPSNESQSQPPKPLLRLPRPRRPTPIDHSLITAMAVDPSLADSNALIVQSSDTVVRRKVDDFELDTKLIQRLKESGIDNFFQVQEVVIPLLLNRPKRKRDLLVSAPTGSGKTLAYALPIIQTLSKRVVTRLRALIVVPTRDLVMQVRETFDVFSRGTGLKIGTVTGQNSFSQEQRSIISNIDGASKVDVLIATPGRLLDHLTQTSNLTLQHLSFLVIDEADRLMNQSFQDWLSSVLQHLEFRPIHARPIEPIAESWIKANEVLQSTGVMPKIIPSTQKLLFSATLSRDPTQISALCLHDPLFVAIKEDHLEGVATEEAFSLPSALTEHMIITVSTSKPLMLFHLLYNTAMNQALCFTKSVSSAMRLVKLVQFFENIYGSSSQSGIETICSYSSDLPSSERSKILTNFKEGHIRLLVCSDLIARGIDLPHVEKVINYDVPIDMRKYVHRVGRTARAGQLGEAWTLVESQEAAFFKEMLSNHGRYGKVKKVRVRKEDIQKFEQSYEAALDKLKEFFVGIGVHESA